MQGQPLFQAMLQRRSDVIYDGKSDSAGDYQHADDEGHIQGGTKARNRIAECGESCIAESRNRMKSRVEQRPGRQSGTRKTDIQRTDSNRLEEKSRYNDTAHNLAGIDSAVIDKETAYHPPVEQRYAPLRCGDIQGKERNEPHAAQFYEQHQHDKTEGGEFFHPD